MTKILYLSNARIPTEKAHGIQIMKMCEAFADGGVTVELVLPWRFNSIKDNPFDYHGIKKNFKITKIPSLDLVKFGKIGFWIQSLSFACSAFCYVLLKKADVIYSRDELPLLFLIPVKKKLAFEMHKLPKNHLKLFGFLLKKIQTIISTNRWKKDYICEKFGAPEDKILISPNAIDLEKFFVSLTREEAREKLGLERNKKIILYAGHLYGWKGADILAKAAQLFSKGVSVVFVGGTDLDIAEFKKKYRDAVNVKIIGWRPHSEIPFYLKAADVLVLPNVPATRESEYETSPIKLFEYMASGTPIAASNLPSIREILNKNNAVLFESGNSQALTAGVEKILNDRELADKISKQAFRDVQSHTWRKRAGIIMNFLF